MFPNIDPRSLKKMMKQMGMNMEEIPANEVIIKQPDGKEISIKDPKVTKMKVPGQGDSFQIMGEVSEGTSVPEISEEDINMVAEQTKVSKEKAKEAIEKANGDIAKAILSLQDK